MNPAVHAIRNPNPRTGINPVPTWDEGPPCGVGVRGDPDYPEASIRCRGAASSGASPYGGWVASDLWSALSLQGLSQCRDATCGCPPKKVSGCCKQPWLGRKRPLVGRPPCFMRTGSRKRPLVGPTTLNSVYTIRPPSPRTGTSPVPTKSEKNAPHSGSKGSTGSA